MADKYTWTGERLETFITDGTMLEHLHRYAMVAAFCKGKRILDIACGEGFGSHLIAEKAAQVWGIDIHEPTIQNANKKYKKPNLHFLTGDITSIPLDKLQFDIILCFETIEHIEQHEQAIRECKRVLTAEGVLIISTPDKLHYSQQTNYKNPFHKKELSNQEFKTLIANNFKFANFYKQNSFAASFIESESEKNITQYFQGNYEEIEELQSISPMYCIAIASDVKPPLLNGSIFLHKQTVNQLLQDENNAVKNTKTYKTGNFILWPFKMLKSVIKK
ncbi:MAG: class I SAM-dependent methyltransferase [Chitinophagaceae bacterium]|nr:class I SAM-dependent methyltransferase [Chitinophagaceae bacterium]